MGILREHKFKFSNVNYFWGKGWAASAEEYENLVAACIEVATNLEMEYNLSNSSCAMVGYDVTSKEHIYFHPMDFSLKIREGNEEKFAKAFSDVPYFKDQKITLLEYQSSQEDYEKWVTWAVRDSKEEV